MPASNATPSSSPLRSPLPFIAMTELRMGLRTGVFRFMMLLMVAFGWSNGSIGGRGVGMSAYATGEAACQYMGILVVIWVALGAVRDTALRTDVLVFTKPQPPERMAFARFLGLLGQVLCFLLGLFVGAILGRLFSEGNLLGFSAYGLQFLRAACVLFFVSCASYCLALLTESPIAGSLVGLYWVVVMTGKEFLAKYYYPWYSQNLPGYLCLGVALLGFALWFCRRRLRGATKAALPVRILSPLALLLGFWLLWTTVRDGHDPMTRQNPNLERVSTQNMTEGALTPGFLFPNQEGKPTSLSQFPGKILLIALWSPRDPDSTLLLAHLEAFHAKYGARGVLPIAVCLSEDAGAATTFAQGEQLSFPMVYDWGTHNASRQDEISPLALAYRADHLPRLVLTDRRHRVVRILDGLSAYESTELEKFILQRLEEEPE